MSNDSPSAGGLRKSIGVGSTRGAALFPATAFDIRIEFIFAFCPDLGCNHLLARIRRTGFRYCIAIVLGRLVPAWLCRCRKFDVFALRIAASPGAEAKSPLTDLRFKQADSETEFSAAEELTQFCRGSKQDKLTALCAFDGSRMVGCLWIASAVFDEPELGLRVKLEPNQAWLFSAYVARTHRGRGMYRQLVRLAHEACQQHNPPKQIYFSINPDNRQSMLAHQKIGAHKIGRALVIKLGRWSFGRAWGQSTGSSQIQIRRVSPETCAETCPLPMILSIPARTAPESAGV